MWNRNVREAGGRSRTRFKILRQRNPARIIKIEKFLRRGRRTVGLIKTDSQEERLVLVALEIFDRSRSDFVIAMRFAITIKHHDSIRSGRSWWATCSRRAFGIIRFASSLAGRHRAG